MYTYEPLLLIIPWNCHVKLYMVELYVEMTEILKIQPTWISYFFVFYVYLNIKFLYLKTQIGKLSRGNHKIFLKFGKIFTQQ